MKLTHPYTKRKKNQKWKSEHYNRCHRNMKDDCEQLDAKNLDKLIGNGEIPGHIPLTKVESWIGNPKRPIMSDEVGPVMKRPPGKEKPETWWLHYWVLSDISIRIILMLCKLFPKKLKRKEFLETLSMRPTLPWHQNQTRTEQKRKAIDYYPRWTQMQNSSTKY